MVTRAWSLPLTNGSWAQLYWVRKALNWAWRANDGNPNYGGYVNFFTPEQKHYGTRQKENYSRENIPYCSNEYKDLTIYEVRHTFTCEDTLYILS